MDTEKIWKEGEWTNEARQIIDGLKKFPDNSKIILVLRHSHRNAQTALEGAQKTVLYGDAKKLLMISMKVLKMLAEQAK